MELIEIMLALRENNSARVRIDPRVQLAALYAEIQSMRSEITSVEDRLGQVSAARDERLSEIDNIIVSKPVWEREIENAKEILVHKRGLTLKEMLNIQQEVARVENDLSQADSRIESLSLEARQLSKRRKLILLRLRDLKAQYNQHAAIYNEEKVKADELLAVHDAVENDLLQKLTPEDRTVYAEALRLNPESPIVILDRDICVGCRIGLSKQLIKHVNQLRKLVCCENCVRVILPDIPGMAGTTDAADMSDMPDMSDTPDMLDIQDTPDMMDIPVNELSEERD